jgi:hypothetical protein
MEYATLQLSQRNDALIVTILQNPGYTGDKLFKLNRCRVTNKMLFLSDITTACGRYVSCNLLGPLAPWLGPRSIYNFPQEVLSPKDWLLWRTFWTLYLGPGGLLNIPLGKWLHPSHRIWEWFYDPLQDQLQHVRNNAQTVYEPIHTKQDTRHTQHYYRHSTDSNTAIGSPCNVRQLSPTTVQRRETGLQLTQQREASGTFWEHLKYLGGKWMWEYVKEGEIDISWLKDALTAGTLVGVTDGSYHRHKAKSCSRAGWVLACRSSKKTLRGSFYKVPSVAGSYCSELLGLVAIHTLILAAAEYYQLEHILGKISCDNMSALNQASKVRKRVQSGIKHSDLQ